MMKAEEFGDPDICAGLPELDAVARRDLGETTEVKERSLSALRQLIAGDESLHCPADDPFLVKYLRSRKYRVEETFQMIRNYFSARQRLPEFFADLSPHKVPYRRIIVHNGLILVCKERDPQGRTVFVIKFGAWNTGICSVTDLFRAGLVMAEWNLENQESQIRGVVGVIDLKGFHMSHLTCFTPFLIKKVSHIVQVHFMGYDLNKLHGILPPDCIPAEFGGTHEDFDYYSQEEDVKSIRDYFERVSLGLSQ
ncbi:alpha-tocopherol transfer protein-like isoform X2 [Haemaphysalis longicornis]